MSETERRDKSNAADCHNHWEDSLSREEGQYKEFKEKEAKTAEDKAQGQDTEEEQTAPKRGGGANQSANQKTRQGSRGGPDGIAGDKTRVPDKGQKVQWETVTGLHEGEVVEVVYEETTVEGRAVKGSKEDPQLVLRCNSSGKIAVHKPEAVYFH